MKFRSTLLPFLATILNNVEATFDFVERIVRLVAFDNVALTLLLVWTGLYAAHMQRNSPGAARGVPC